MPRPTPVKMAPPANPRSDGGTRDSTAGAARAIRTPPETPDAKRQTKNQPKESGRAQAKNAAVATVIIARKPVAEPARSAIGRASKAPATYPARLAAPRYAAADGANQWAAINAGISGVYAKRARPTPTIFAHNSAETARQYAVFPVDATAHMTGRFTFLSAKVGAPIPGEKQE